MSKAAALDDGFARAVLSAVAEIPEGHIVAYGQLARLIGYPENARLVAHVLSRVGYYGDYPCRRAVNAIGHLALGRTAQAMLLKAEGIALINAMHVSLKLYRWEA